MTPEKRRRRVALLCCHFTRNLAYFRAGWHDEFRLFPKTEFWLTMSGNGLDISVLEWCKIFADLRGKHSWRKVVTDEDAFQRGLLDTLGLTQDQYDTNVNNIKRYRDKFVAHLDDEDTMEIPEMEMAKKSIIYIYDYLTTVEALPVMPPLPLEMEDYYKLHNAHAESLFLVP